MCVHEDYTECISGCPLLKELNGRFLLRGRKAARFLVWKLALEEGIGVLGLRSAVDWVLSLRVKVRMRIMQFKNGDTIGNCAECREWSGDGRNITHHRVYRYRR